MTLNADGLIATAHAQTGLSDFGDPSFREGLDVFVSALNDEALLTPRALLSCRGRRSTLCRLLLPARCDQTGSSCVSVGVFDCPAA
jgi:hypothetical protein